MSLEDSLRERMLKPQRHRLLQGFPAVPAMQLAGPARERGAVFPSAIRAVDGALRTFDFHADREPMSPHSIADWANATNALNRRPRPDATVQLNPEPPYFTIDRERALIVGIIPHTQCVPRKEACGFCTFPHDKPSPLLRNEMRYEVINDIQRVCAHTGLRGRNVEAIYLGGGTANLSEPAEIVTLVSVLANHLQIAQAELTLEGTPHLFERLFSSHLKTLAKLPVAHKRISIGMQTFEPNYQRMMGRDAFGDASTVKKLVRRCESLGITTSCDLLYNLPGQSRDLMLQDVQTAIDLGLHQICLYNLVLYEGLGTPWSREKEYVDSMPSNATACENWLVLRDRLLQRGYVQTTLTNFERADIAASEQRFRYETASFSVERTDGLGFGALSLTTLLNTAERKGIKLVRRKQNASRAAWANDDLMYRYDERSLRALFLTRGLAKTQIDPAIYQSLFGSSLKDDLKEPLDLLQTKGLLHCADDSIALTPRGMFYADAVVSLLAMSTGAQSQGEGIRTHDLLQERFVMADHYGGMG